MNTFKSLYFYECKKIWNRKIVKISLILCLILVVISGTVRLFGNYVVDGDILGSNYDEIKKDQGYARELNGRKIDQNLLEEMVAAYRKVPVTPEKHYTGSPEYQKYARPYSEIFNFTIGNTDLLPMDIFENWEPSEEYLYSQRQIQLEKKWKDAGLSDGEMNFWQQRENQIEKPIVFQENEAYNQTFLGFQTIGFIAILFLSISLSGLFPEEHGKRTDQLVLSSIFGKKKVYWAKILSGVSYAVGITLLFIAITTALLFVLYGCEGFNAPFQLHYRSSSDPISVGQAMLISYGNMLVTAVLISIIVMVLSELLHSGIAALAISSGLLIASMVVSVPEYYRILSQIWNWQPWCFLFPSTIFGKYTLSLFGIHFTPWQCIPVIYILTSMAIAWGGKFVYQRYQVSGR